MSNTNFTNLACDSLSVDDEPIILTGGGGGLQFLLTDWSTSVQEPVSEDTPLQVEFGTGGTSSGGEVTLDSSGNLTINEDGDYQIVCTFAGRRGSNAGLAPLLIQPMLNGSVDTTIPASNQLAETAINVLVEKLSWTRSYVDTDVITIEIAQDDAGAAHGQLTPFTPATLAWTTSASARIEIFKVV